MSDSFSKYRVLSDGQVNYAIDRIENDLFKQDPGGDNGWFGDTAESETQDRRRQAFQIVLNNCRREGMAYHSHTAFGYVFEVLSEPLTQEELDEASKL